MFMQLIIFAQGRFGREMSEIVSNWIPKVLSNVQIDVENRTLQTAIQIAEEKKGFCLGIITPELREINVKKLASEQACLLLARVWKHEIKTGLDVLEFGTKGIMALMEKINAMSEEKMDSVVLRKKVKSLWSELVAKYKTYHRESNREETEFMLSKVLSM